MSSCFALGVMARAPVPGETKTRLIPLLGAEGAASLQRELTLQALRTATLAAPQAVTLFTAGDPRHPFWSECRQRHGVPVVEQQGEHLGARMLHALQALLRTHDVAVLIGTDCPALRPQHLTELCERLQHARIGFIPAEDGGYVAVAAREPTPSAFGALDWGTSAVMQQTLAALTAIGWQRDRDWTGLAPLWDVDRPEDLQRAIDQGLIGSVAASGERA
jgi:uncharacterized protein